MLLLFERTPHRLDLGICLKVRIGFGILESEFLICLEEVAEQKGIDAFALIIRPYADKEHVESVRLLPVHCLEKVPVMGS